ncbi:hypothetical protein [Flavobacterium sp. UBA7682]|uniref:hypothetical protein n=1 Tax=Flavobacterium sp. UBA7682 TaxID=1946560 RepID=UPI0025BE9C48|nr:hypothetical protein [Flavobacterium sp. UBA7682]
MTYNLLFEITFDKKSKRKQPIRNNYRPGFEINKNSFFSGTIRLIDTESLLPGETCNAIVGFFSNEPFKDLKKEDVLDFYEVPNKIGTSKLIEVIGWGDL